VWSVVDGSALQTVTRLLSKTLTETRNKDKIYRHQKGKKKIEFVFFFLASKEKFRISSNITRRFKMLFGVVAVKEVSLRLFTFYPANHFTRISYLSII
jgi:hypothetical protein